MAALGGKLVLYSGVNGLSTDAPQDDTWEWDGGTWTQRSVTGPGGRYAHTMATLGNKIVLFGGIDQSASHWLSDTWEWDGNVWTQRPVTGPGPRQDAGMVATLP
jgi:N-acetylneuraminic acid mutarotase